MIVAYCIVSIATPDYSQALRDGWRAAVNPQFPSPENVVVVKIEVTATALPPVSISVPTPTVANAASEKRTPSLGPTNATTPRADVTPMPTVTSNPTVTPKPEPTTPSGLSAKKLEAARQYALDLINAERAEVGRVRLTLDDNSAPQLHAEDMRRNCFSSHWGSDGLKPQMRHTLSGGVSYVTENISGTSYCPTSNHYAVKTVGQHLDTAMTELMNSSGHRRNVLDPHHRTVSIGAAYEHPNFWLVQVFGAEYVEYTDEPAIRDGILTFAGTLRNGARIEKEADLSVQIYYDPPPRSLTRGQLARTYCVGYGRQLVALRWPLPPNWSYPTDSYRAAISFTCADPYEIPSSSSTPGSYEEAAWLLNVAARKHWMAVNRFETVDWLTADIWDISGSGFQVEADVGALIDEHGDGVYMIMVWADVHGENRWISEYSLFVADRNSGRNGDSINP